MQTQTQNPVTQNPVTQNPVTQPDILQQFSDLLKRHSIAVSDRENVVKFLEDIVELCTQMPKTKLKAAVKAASKPSVAKKTTTPAKKKQEEKLVGPEDAGDCPLVSDIVKPVAARRGRPRKNAQTEQIGDHGNVAVPAAEAEKKKRGRPKKDKTLVVSSNDDEDELIAKMIADVRSLKSVEPVVNHADDDDATEDERSPVVITTTTTAIAAPVEVEADVPITDVLITETSVPTKGKGKGKATPKEKVNTPKEKITTPKEKVTKSAKNKTVPAPAPAPVAPVSVSVPSPAAEVPTRENKAGRDGKFYLMPNFPRSSFSYNGNTYLRTETDNVYDNLTLEMIGVWDHLNHEIITAFDEDVEDLWMSEDDEE
jgi:hypothetical protein